ncbi:uncharacterized protein [Aegilops tauschii subsp. strangulata]|uniref:uncharacterized protein n=1 Tax=Aegilops tauschii subsp. strangulata TaxID=200361 RepID=UPI003CC8401D
MVSDDAFDPRRASASSAAAVPPPSTLATESPFMASTPPAWARPAASGSRPPAPRSPAMHPSLAHDASLAPNSYGASAQQPRDGLISCVQPRDGLISRDVSLPQHFYNTSASLPYGGTPSRDMPPASGSHGAPVQVPYGGPYPAPYVAPSPAQYAPSSAVPYKASYGAPYAAPAPYVAPPLQPYVSHVASLQPYGVPPTAPYGHHQHYRPSPSADALIPYSAPPTYDSQLSASATEPGPFHFAHLVTVKLSADNYLLWRAQVLPLMRSHYLEGYVDGTLPCPPAMVPVPSAAGGSVMVSNPAHRRWIAQDQAILGAIQSSLTPSVAGMVVFAATSRDAWATLDSSFSSQSLARSSAIRNQLGEVKKNDLSVTAFFNKVKSLADTLSSIGKPLRDEEFTSFILNGLDEDYDSLVENINGRDTPMPPRDLYARLLNTEQRLAARRSVGVYTQGPSANAALRGGARGAKQKAPPTSGNQPRPPAPSPTAGRKRLHCEACGGGVECQLCGIEGHLASRCHRRFKRDFLGIGNNGKGNEKQAALATPDPGFTPSYSVDPAWYMDMGATDHLTSQLDKLATRQPYTGHDQVRTANGSGTGRGARLELLDDDMATTAPVAATPDEALDEAAPATTPLDPDVDHACMPHARGSDGVTKSPGPAASLSPGPAEPTELSAGPAGPAALSPEPEASQVTESLSPGPSTPITPGLSSPTLTVPPDASVDSPAGASSSPLMDSGSSGMAAPAPPPPVVLRPHTRSKSGIFQPKKRTDGTVAWLAACVAHAEADPTTEPRHFRAALGIPHWRAAMEQEIHALQRNNTWRLVPPPSGVNIIDSKWVFKVKKHADGSIERYKARLVAKGFKHRLMFRMPFSMEFWKKRFICVSHQVLLTLLSHIIYVALSKLSTRPEVTMYILVYVDDIILVSSSASATDRLVSSLGDEFAVKDLGRLHYFLGLEVLHSDGGLTLTQKKYSQDLLRRAGMLQCKSATTPMSATDKLTALAGDLLAPEDATEYRSIVGGLQYLLITRPDISFAVNRVCQYLHAPRDSH